MLSGMPVYMDMKLQQWLFFFLKLSDCGNDRDNEGSFVWSSDNTVPDFYNWSPVEPNSHTDDDDCIVVIYPVGEGADFGSTAKVPFLCKKGQSSL